MPDFGALFSSIPHQLAVFLISMLPVAELRAAIPIGINAYNMSWPTAFAWSVLGNIAVVALILWLLEPLSRWLSARSETMRRFFDWLFNRTRRRVTRSFERWGAVALVLFVAIPLPMTGGWTGAIAAFVFGIPRLKAAVLVGAGVVIAGIIVTIVTVGIGALV